MDQEDYIKEANGTGDVIDSSIAASSYNAASGPIAYDDREESTLGRAHLNEEKREDNLQDVSQVSAPIKPQQEPR